MVARSQYSRKRIALSPTEIALQTGGHAHELVEASPDAMVVVNNHGQIVLVNRRAEDLFGYERGELIGQPVERLIPRRFRRRHIRHRDRYLANCCVRSMGLGLDLYGLHKDGDEFPVEIELGPIHVGAMTVVCAAVRDISQRKIAEALLHTHRLLVLRMLAAKQRDLAKATEELHFSEAMASVGLVGTGLIHDLNNLLLPIKARIEQLGRQGAGPNQEHIRAIREAADYLQQLGRRFSTLVTKGEPAEPAGGDLDLHRWWSSIELLIATILPRKIRLRVELADDLPHVVIPRIELTQAVLNLAQNAGRAMNEQESGTLTIRAEQGEDDQAVRLSISDTGPGIPFQVKERLFQPFTTTRGPGAAKGMGLAVVKAIVTRAKGLIDVHSEVGQGTTFTLTLPAARIRMETVSSAP